MPETNHYFDGTPVTSNVKGCARCGEDHEPINFNPLTRPVLLENGDVDMTHWAACPTNSEPILMRFLETESSPPDDETPA